jgi:dextranase
MRVWVGVAIVLGILVLQGGFVGAVGSGFSIAPDKAFYRPGEVVTLNVSAGEGVRVEAAVMSLSETITTLSAALVAGKATLTWTPPAASLKGYGVDVVVTDAQGRTVASGSTAFDVLDRWIQAPRYGFLSDFRPGRTNIDTTMAEAAAYHVNGLQFYDWQYRHEQLLPPANAMSGESETYSDVLGKVESLTTIKQLITAAHEYNIAAMPYSAIYGASYAFYNQHPDWALFAAKDQPFDFAGFLKIMDPTPGSPWAAHLLSEYADVLNNTAFDGIHIDQYGAPMHGLNAAGGYVKLEDSFPAFINATAALVHQLRGESGVTIFNLVRNWPVKTVAPSGEDAVYIEVWEPYRSFMDLPRIVSQAQALGGGKPVILAAYIPPDRIANVRLTNALIFASGGYHLELGEPAAMLADPYFPRFGIMSEELQEIERCYYDFLVRYENVLALGTTDATKDRALALSIAGVETAGYRSQDRVAVIVRQSKQGSFETFSLIDLMGIDGGYWDEALKQSPTPLHDLAVRVGIPEGKTVARMWLASPDGDSSAMQAVDFTTDSSAIAFSVPTLDYWTMLVVEYAS